MSRKLLRSPVQCCSTRSRPAMRTRWRSFEAWCFVAAMLSVIIYGYLRADPRGRPPGENSSSCGSDRPISRNRAHGFVDDRQLW